MGVQINVAGGKAVELSDENFGVDYNEALIHQVVVAYLAGGRAGTSAQKNRSAVSGGGKKPWRQKGTGRARAGTIRSPIFRGGGRAFPNQTRSYAQKVNRKMYRGAIRSILSELARQDRLLGADDLVAKEIKTKALVEQLSAKEVDNALIVTAERDENLVLSARNIPHVEVVSVAEIDPVSLVKYEKVLMSSDALKQLDEALS